jgi:hypothetical protein
LVSVQGLAYKIPRHSGDFKKLCDKSRGLKWYLISNSNQDFLVI